MIIRGNKGQSTVEFAVVLAGLIALTIALGAIWRAVDGGALVSHALSSASHHLASGDVGAAGDVLVY